MERTGNWPEAQLEVLARERKLHQESVRASIRTLRAMLHPEFEGHIKDGDTLNREEYLHHLGNDEHLEPAWGYHPVQLGDDLVILTYCSGNELDPVERSSTWVRDGDAWLLRRHRNLDTRKVEGGCPDGATALLPGADQGQGTARGG